MLTNSEYNPLSQKNYTETNLDPLSFLEFIIVDMIESIKDKCNIYLIS